VGGLPEVIDEGRTGYLVEPGNLGAWQMLLQNAVSNPEPLRKLGKNGPEWVASRYNFADNLKQMQELYQEIVGEAGR
jgi:glycosyltransferase involved in cell wall biosynthesis